MEFMDLLKEWLELWANRFDFPEWDRLAELEAEINARMRGELPR